MRLGLVSATLSRGSSRRSRTATALLRDAYAALEVVGAIDAADADRLVQLGVRPQSIVVTGDTRYDQVWLRRSASIARAPRSLRLRSDRPTIVAGSTWPADESVLLPAFATLRSGGVSARLIIAPHEPTLEHVGRLVEWAQRAGIAAAKLDEPSAGQADVVIIDRLGVLGELYALADMAFVGGGFHAAGLHSVLEPAAFGAPVMFGPRNDNSRDAALLVQRGGGAAVMSESELARRLRLWSTDITARREAGDFARALVRSGVGAAERSFELIERLVR